MKSQGKRARVSQQPGPLLPSQRLPALATAAAGLAALEMLLGTPGAFPQALELQWGVGITGQAARVLGVGHSPPNPPSPRACVGAGRGQKPPQQPPAPHRQQLVLEIWDFTPSPCRSAGVVWLSTPPARLRRPLTAGASAPAGTRASAGAGCVQVGACHGQDFSSVPRKHASPGPSVLGSSSHNPNALPGSPVAPQPAEPRALGSLRGCTARWC